VENQRDEKVEIGIGCLTLPRPFLPPLSQDGERARLHKHGILAVEDLHFLAAQNEQLLVCMPPLGLESAPLQFFVQQLSAFPRPPLGSRAPLYDTTLAIQLFQDALGLPTITKMKLVTMLTSLGEAAEERGGNDIEKGKGRGRSSGSGGEAVGGQADLRGVLERRRREEEERQRQRNEERQRHQVGGLLSFHPLNPSNPPLRAEGAAPTRHSLPRANREPCKPCNCREPV